jgi:hypothetical protein
MVTLIYVDKTYDAKNTAVHKSFNFYLLRVYLTTLPVIQLAYRILVGNLKERNR